MEKLFKNVKHYNDSIHAYELGDYINDSERQTISGMFEHLDLAVLQKCWTSVLFELPIIIVMVSDKSDKNKVILDNLREIDSMMAICGINPRGEKLYLDPRSCELTLDKNNQFFPLENVFDTVNMLECVEQVKNWDLDDKEKDMIIDNLKEVNKRIQMFEITFRYLFTNQSERDRLSSYLKQFYSDLYAYI